MDFDLARTNGPWFTVSRATFVVSMVRCPHCGVTLGESCRAVRTDNEVKPHKGRIDRWVKFVRPGQVLNVRPVPSEKRPRRCQVQDCGEERTHTVAVVDDVFTVWRPDQPARSVVVVSLCRDHVPRRESVGMYL